MNKPLVAVLVGLIALGTINFVMAAAPGTIQNVFVTNWQRNQNVTVTNPPVVVVNITITTPAKPQPLREVIANNVTITANPSAVLSGQFITCQTDPYRINIPAGYAQMQVWAQKLDYVNHPIDISSGGVWYGLSYDGITVWSAWQIGNVTVLASSTNLFFDPGPVPPYGFSGQWFSVQGPYLIIYVSNCYNLPQQYSLAVYLTA